MSREGMLKFVNFLISDPDKAAPFGAGGESRMKVLEYFAETYPSERKELSPKDIKFLTNLLALSVSKVGVEIDKGIKRLYPSSKRRR